MSARPLHGLLAEFTEADDLLTAAREAHSAGYQRLDAFSPFPVPGVFEAMGGRRGSLIPLAVLLGGIVGAVSGYALQYWVSVIHYPLNVGGRPLHSWPAFIPVTFELGILFGALTGVVAMLALNGLPRPNHPLFDVPGFERATRDRFFLLVEARDPRFDPGPTRDFLQTLHAEAVRDVPA
jgi:hypothetical protein